MAFEPAVIGQLQLVLLEEFGGLLDFTRLKMFLVAGVLVAYVGPEVVEITVEAAHLHAVVWEEPVHHLVDERYALHSHLRARAVGLRIGRSDGLVSDGGDVGSDAAGVAAVDVLQLLGAPHPPGGYVGHYPRHLSNNGAGVGAELALGLILLDLPWLQNGTVEEPVLVDVQLVERPVDLRDGVEGERISERVGNEVADHGEVWVSTGDTLLPFRAVAPHELHKALGRGCEHHPDLERLRNADVHLADPDVPVEVAVPVVELPVAVVAVVLCP